MILSFDALQEAGYNPRTTLVKRQVVNKKGEPVIDKLEKRAVTEDALETRIVNSKGFPLKNNGKDIIGVGADRESSMRDAIAKAAAALGIDVVTKSEIELLKEKLAALEAKVNGPASPKAVTTATAPSADEDLDEDDDIDDFPDITEEELDEED